MSETTDKYLILSLKNDGIVGATRRLLSDLLSKGVIETVLVPLEVSPGVSVAAIVSDVDKLELANPFLPLLPINTARLVSRVTRLESSPVKMGVVLRSCEMRALIELVKLKQASLENLLLIGIDCIGTYSLAASRQMVSEDKSPADVILDNFRGNTADPLLRRACQICEQPVPSGVDITLGLFGAETDKNMLVISNSPKGEEALRSFSFESCAPEQRQAAIGELIASRAANKEKVLNEVGKNVSGLNNLLDLFSACVNCHNCRRACPICYCKECFFDSDTFEYKADKFLNWSKRKGAVRLPSDMLAYHLTRMNHMAASCVGCGLCTEACPNNIPVSDIFRLVGLQVQKKIGYTPGRSLEDELPLTTFREDELTDLGV